MRWSSKAVRSQMPSGPSIFVACAIILLGFQFPLHLRVSFYNRESGESADYPETPHEVESQHGLKVGDTVAATGATMPKATFSLYDQTSHCRLRDRKIRFLGDGMDGHAFVALVRCSSSLGKKDKQLVIKLPVKRDDKKTYNYFSVPKTDGSRSLYERMLTNSSERTVLPNFAIPIGTARVALKMLHINSNAHEERHMQRFRDAVNGTEGGWITGKVMPFVSGERLANIVHRSSPHRMERSLRRRIVKDLVYMYRYMVERKVVHCDISLSHLMWNDKTNSTVLIDFDRHLIMGDHSKERDLQHKSNVTQNQQRQLLGLVCNVCAHDTDMCEVQNNVGKRRPLGLSGQFELVEAAMEKCRFPEPFLLPKLLNEDNLDKIYEDLSSWSMS